MKRALRYSPLIVLLLAACASVPSGPSMMVLPGTGKSFDQFRIDDASCRQYASAQTAVTPQQASQDAGVRSAALGAALGAVAGAAIGGHEGAGVGAGTGLVVGSLAGTGAASQSAYSLQQRYDFAYEQCMYAKGDKIPVRGRFASSLPSQARHAPRDAPPANYAPPIPPPPPPGR